MEKTLLISSSGTRPRWTHNTVVVTFTLFPNALLSISSNMQIRHIRKAKVY